MIMSDMSGWLHDLAVRMSIVGDNEVEQGRVLEEFRELAERQMSQGCDVGAVSSSLVCS